MYLLDTNTVSELMKQNQYTWKLLLEKNRTDVFLCEVVISEICYGLALLGNSKKKRTLQKEFESLIEVIQTLTWNRSTSQKFGEIKAKLSNKGTIIADLDITIAAHAMSYGFVLVTDNLSDFKKIVGLRIENWRR